jgi:hypothetical protein
MKTIKILLLIYFFVFVKYVYAQEKEAIALGDTLIKNGDVVSAIEEYKKAFIINPKNPETAYSLAAALSVNRQTDSALKYLYVYISLDTTVYPCVDPDFLHARENEGWDEFENKLMQGITVKSGKSFNDPDYTKKLWKMQSLDQAYYKEIETTERKFGIFSTVETALWDLKERINKQNVNDLEKLIVEKGWPKKSIVGDASGSAFLIIQHSTLELQKKYLPEIKKLCEEKEAKWSDYAMMYDRVQTKENKPQRYGTQIKYNPDTKTFELFPLEDETMVDEWRKEVGLGRLAGYVSQWGITFQPKKK